MGVGANLSSNIDILNTFIELYDVGKIKPKLIKNTAENKRTEDRDVELQLTCCYLVHLHKLLDGARAEDDFLHVRYGLC